MLDLTRAMNCLKPENRPRAGAQVGKVLKDFSGGAVSYREGDVVLFVLNYDTSDRQRFMERRYGEERRLTGKVTVEIPMTQKQIDEQRAKSSLIRTMGTIVNVPAEYVEEIRVT